MNARRRKGGGGGGGGAKNRFEGRPCSGGPGGPRFCARVRGGGAGRVRGRFVSVWNVHASSAARLSAVAAAATRDRVAGLGSSIVQGAPRFVLRK